MTLNSSYLTREFVQDNSWFKEVAMVLGASAIMALFAPVSIPLPFTPVPLAMQGHVILLLACLLGARRACFAVLALFIQGAIGLPVFSGGATGILHLAGPCGGYLLGYLVAAFVTGLMMERTASRTPLKACAAMGLGNLVIYFFGLPWLSRFVGWENAFILGMLPFLIGDALKLVVATRSLKSLRFFSA